MPQRSGRQDFSFGNEAGTVNVMSARTDHLIARLRAIPDGFVADTARKAKLTYRQLLRLRKGERIEGIRLSTLERLATALGVTVGTLLGETADQIPTLTPLSDAV